jgi:transposase
MHDEGYDFEEIGRIQGIDGGTIERYERDFSNRPLDEFLQFNYVGKYPLLNAENLAKLEAQLNEFLDLTLKEIVEYAFHSFGVEYKKEGMRDLLKRMGFRFKKSFNYIKS